MDNDVRRRHGVEGMVVVATGVNRQCWAHRCLWFRPGPDRRAEKSAFLFGVRLALDVHACDLDRHQSGCCVLAGPWSRLYAVLHRLHADLRAGASYMLADLHLRRRSRCRRHVLRAVRADGRTRLHGEHRTSQLIHVACEMVGLNAVTRSSIEEAKRKTPARTPTT